MNKNTLLAQKELSLALIAFQPEASARIIEKLAPNEVASFLKDIPTEFAITLFKNMLPQSAAHIFSKLNDTLATQILTSLELYQATTIIRFLARDRRNKIIENLATQKQTAIVRAMQYSTNSVGAWMISPILTIREGSTISEIQNSINNNPNAKFIDHLFVVDANQSLKGYVSIRKILTNDAEMKIDEIITPELNFIYGHDSLNSVKWHTGWHLHDSLPVINRDMKLVGILRNADLRKGLDQHLVDSSLGIPTEKDVSFFDIYRKTMATLIETIGRMIKN